MLACLAVTLYVAGGAAFVAFGGKREASDGEQGLDRCSVSSPLRTLASAQADFHANDRDGNGVQDFWRKDVAGLYTTLGSDKKPIALIELKVALADEAPAGDLRALGTRAPVFGYWLRAIPHEGEDPAKPDPQRFAYVMYPADIPKRPKYTFIIDENNTIYRSILPPGTKVTEFPSYLSESVWSKLD